MEISRFLFLTISPELGLSINISSGFLQETCVNPLLITHLKTPYLSFKKLLRSRQNRNEKVIVLPFPFLDFPAGMGKSITQTLPLALRGVLIRSFLPWIRSPVADLR